MGSLAMQWCEGKLMQGKPVICLQKL